MRALPPILLLFLCLLSACGPQLRRAADERVIRRTVDALVQAFNQRDPDRLIQHSTVNYRRKLYQGTTADELRRIWAVTYPNNEQITDVKIETITIEGDRATGRGSYRLDGQFVRLQMMMVKLENTWLADDFIILAVSPTPARR